MFPIKNYKYTIPESPSPGAFGAVRKYDVHTGVDLYCEEGTVVYNMEIGIITAIIPFTGPIAELPWWEDTYAILVYNPTNNRTILYGEVTPAPSLKIGVAITGGWKIGTVKRVLKKDKGIVPSTSMLHMELYEGKVEDCVSWQLNESQPALLKDISDLLRKEAT